MKCKNILIPTDGNPSSQEVIDFLCSAQRILDCALHVVYIIEVPRNLPLGTQIPEKVQAAKAALEQAEAVAARVGAVIQTSTVYARTAEDSILSTAQDLKCDVIAIAQENQKLRLFSNTALNINQRAKCSVWLFNNKS